MHSYFAQSMRRPYGSGNSPTRHLHCRCALLAVAVAALSFHPSPGYAEDAKAQGEAVPSEVVPSDAAAWEFQLQVNGPDGEPVPRTKLSFRTAEQLAKEQVLQGEFFESNRQHVRVATDDLGVLKVRFAKLPSGLVIHIEHAGYAPYWAEWRSSGDSVDIPQEFTAVLYPAWSVGGIVVDESGKPVEGAVVNPSIEFKRRPGDTGQLGVGTEVKTDKQGAWHYDCVPADMSSVHVSIDYPNYQPLRQDLARATYELKPDQQPTARLEIIRGLEVRGRVTDAVGEPIVGALVRTKFLNEIREAKTDDSGHYTLHGCERAMARIVVSATGKATDMQEVRVDKETPPVDFEMQPGGRVRIQVVDEHGVGIPKARIFFQRWRGRIDYFEFDHVSEYTDEHGVWEWNEAPLDAFAADICRPGGMQLSEQSIIAREEDYVFSPPPALVVSGAVTDAKTGNPIEHFRVIPGLRSGGRSSWSSRDTYDATGGKYSVRLTHGYPAHLVRIEAQGYRVATSRDIMTDEGKVQVDFALQPAASIAATLETPGGSPAVGAKIAIGVAGSQINVKNGAIDDGSTYATRLDADDEGHFSIPAREDEFQLVVTHPTGFAYYRTVDGLIPSTIRLTPWARAEGTFRVGAQPGVGVTLAQTGSGIHSYGPEVPSIFTSEETTTGADGRYVFERLFPGEGRIGRRIVLMVGDGATEVTSSARVSTTFEAGKTTELNLGGTGVAVIGTLVPPENTKGQVHWPLALVNLSTGILPPPRPDAPAEVRNNPGKNEAWWAEWNRSEAGIAWRAGYQAYEQLRKDTPYFTATVDDQGRFRIEDVPAGTYMLDATFSEKGPGSLSGFRFEVPQSADSGNELHDLGKLQLVK